MLAFLAFAGTLAAGPIDPVVACQVAKGPIRPCPVKAESTPAYSEEYESSPDTLSGRYRNVWVSDTLLRVVTENSPVTTELRLDADGNILKKTFFQNPSNPAAEIEIETYVYHGGRLDSILSNWAVYSFYYAGGRLDSMVEDRSIEKIGYKYAYDPAGQVSSRVSKERDSSGKIVFEDKTEYAYHWPDSVTSKSTSSYRPGDTTYGAFYLRDGLIRKMTNRVRQPSGPIINMMLYWYAGETPGSVARPRAPLSRAALRSGSFTDALGIIRPWSGQGSRGRLAFPVTSEVRR